MWQSLLKIVLTFIVYFCLRNTPTINIPSRIFRISVGQHRMSPRPKIIGGMEAKGMEAPYQVSIRIDGHHFCGGSIYKKRWIITASHCTKGHGLTNMVVVVGSKLLDAGGNTYTIQKKFERRNQDIALLLLKNPIKFTHKIQPVVLPIRNIRGGEHVVASGWGITNLKVFENSNYLQIIKLKTVPFRECKNIISKHKIIDKGSVCTFTRSGEGLCMGDSGGPLTINGNVLVGIVSFGMPCAVGYPDMFTGIFYNKKWIKNVVKKNSYY